METHLLQTVPPETLAGLIQALQAGYALVLAAALVSFLAERVPQFQALSPDVKLYTILGVSLVLGLGAYYIPTVLPADTLAALEGPYAIVQGIITAFMGTQAWHGAIQRGAKTSPIAIKEVLPPAP